MVNNVPRESVLSWLAIKELGYPGAEVPRYLAVTNSCITRAVYMGEAPEREKYI
jgi:hypothetical protein